MPIWISSATLAGALALFALGWPLIIAGLRGARAEDPITPTFNWRKWRPVWSMRSRFGSDRAFHAYVWGVTCWCGGALLALVHSLIVIAP